MSDDWQIIYCHGIGNQPPREEIKAAWDKALFGGDSDISVVAYWAHMRTATPMGLTPFDLFPNKSPLDPYFDAATKAFTKDLVHDVNTYLYDSTIRANILNVVYPVFKDAQESGKKLLVIGHSLGSVVAYEAMLDLHIKAEAYLTIGSPLGIDPLRAALRAVRKEDVLIVPDVKIWHNYSDPCDVVALDHTLKNDFDSKIITDFIVDNLDRKVSSWFGFHSGTGYLSLPVIRDFVSQVMAGGLNVTA